MNYKISEVETVKSYSRTLRSFAVGEERFFSLKDIDYVGFYVARKRLVENKTADFDFKRIKHEGTTLFRIERTR